MADREIFVFENTYKLMDYLVSYWQEYAIETIKKKKHFNAALSGGRTPVEFYCKLSNVDSFELWRDTNIFLTDERFVPADHKDSNARMIKENLINYIFIEPDQFHPMTFEGDDSAISAENYEKELINHFSLEDGALPQFDLALLGVGEDGHTASLFSDIDLVRGRDKLVIATEPIHLQYKRVSLTLPVLNNAKRVICVITGKNKADILYRLIEREENCPAARLSPKKGKLIIMADKLAAHKLIESEEFLAHKEAISFKK